VRGTYRQPAVTLGLVTLLAAVARFALLDRAEFKYDEAQVSSLSFLLVHRHMLPATSILTSGGFHNSPLLVYLLAIPMLLSASPLVLTGFITALNVAAVGGLYLWARRLLGELVAGLAAVLFAVSPLAVHYSRKIWAPDAMPLFTVLLLWGLSLAFVDAQPWGIVLTLVALAVLIQLHQAALALAVVVAILAICFGRRLPFQRAGFWAAMAGGGAGSALLLLPYGAFEWHAGFADVRGMAAQVGGTPALTAVPWQEAWQLVAGWNPELFFAPLAAQEHPSLVGSGRVDWLTLAMVALGIAACALWVVRPDATWLNTIGTRKGDFRPLAAVLLLGALLPLALFTRSAAPVFPHYLVFLTPFWFLLAAIGVAFAGHLLRLAARSPLPQVGVGLIVVVLTVSAVTRSIAFDRNLAAHVIGGDYGVPLSETLAAARALRGALDPTTASGVPAAGHRAVIGASDSDVAAVFSYLALAGLAPPTALVDPNRAQVFPARVPDTWYLFTATDTPAFRATAGVAAAQGHGAPLVRIPAGPASAYTLIGLDSAALGVGSLGKSVSVRPIGPFMAGGELELAGANVSAWRAGAPLDVTLLWHVNQARTLETTPLKLFVHLYDSSRRTVAQDDALGYPNSYWRDGDRFLTWFHLPFPTPPSPGRYTLVAGAYAVEGVRALPVRGPAGQDLGGEIPLGTVTVPG